MTSTGVLISTSIIRAAAARQSTLQTISKGLLFLLDFFFWVEASGRCFKVCSRSYVGTSKSIFQRALLKALEGGENRRPGPVGHCAAGGFCSESRHRSGDAVSAGTSSETGSGWIAGMHFARVILSPTRSQKPADSRKSHSKVLRRSPGRAKLPRRVPKGSGTCLATP